MTKVDSAPWVLSHCHVTPKMQHKQQQQQQRQKQQQQQQQQRQKQERYGLSRLCVTHSTEKLTRYHSIK